MKNKYAFVRIVEAAIVAILILALAWLFSFLVGRQQAVEPMQSQNNYIRGDEGQRPNPAVDSPGGEFPRQAPAGDPDQLLPAIIPVAPPIRGTPN